MLNKIKNVCIRIGLLLFCFGIRSGFAQETSANAASPVVRSFNSIAIIEGGVGTVILVAFVLIVFLLLIFRLISNMMVKKETTAEVAKENIAQKNIIQNSSDEEVSAAISMALYLYSSQIHDQENPVITMIKVSRTYSPWSSKIYGLRKSPR